MFLNLELELSIVTFKWSDLNDHDGKHIHYIRGIGTGPADLATAGPKFPVHQESPQLVPVLYRPALIVIKQLKNFILQLHIYAKAIALLYIIDYYIKNTRY